MKKIKGFDYPNWIPNIISLLKEACIYKICMIPPKEKQIQINLESLKKKKKNYCHSSKFSF